MPCPGGTRCPRRCTVQSFGLFAYADGALTELVTDPVIGQTDMVGVEEVETQSRKGLGSISEGPGMHRFGDMNLGAVHTDRSRGLTTPHSIQKVDGQTHAAFAPGRARAGLKPAPPSPGLGPHQLPSRQSARFVPVTVLPLVGDNPTRSALSHPLCRRGAEGPRA